MNLARLLPRWLQAYQVGWLRGDVVAGLTLAAYAIPVSLAYASLAGLPPQSGIYCYLAGGLAYACVGTSKQLAIGPTSAIAMLVGASAAPLADGDPERAASIAAMTALIVAVLCVFAWICRLSSLMNFVSESVLLGFKAGAALTIALTQLPKLFGVPGGGDHFVERLWLLTSQLPDTKLAVLAFGVVALGVLLLGEARWPGRPVALAVVVISVIVATVFHLKDLGLDVVGELPAGMPAIVLPAVRMRDVDGALPLACACFLLAYIEGVSSARTLAARHGDSIDPRQELLGLGAANVAAALVQGFPVAGGLSQSAVNDNAGARTPLSLICASAALAICLVYLTGLLQNLPTVVLAAILLVAIRGLVDLASLRRLRRISPQEFRVAMAAFVGVLAFGILKGVLLASIASLLMLISAAARPRIAFLGRIPGTNRFTDLERHPDNEVIPGVLVVRVESSILYFNTDFVLQAVWSKVLDTPGLRLVVWDLSSSPFVDVAGARLLSGLQRDLEQRGVQLRLVDAHFRTRELLRAEGLEHQVGYFGRRLTIDQAITESAGGSPCESSHLS